MGPNKMVLVVFFVLFFLYRVIEKWGHSRKCGDNVTSGGRDVGRLSFNTVF